MKIVQKYYTFYFGGPTPTRQGGPLSTVAGMYGVPHGVHVRRFWREHTTIPPQIPPAENWLVPGLSFPHEICSSTRGWYKPNRKGNFSLMHYPRVRKQNGGTNQIIRVGCLVPAVSQQPPGRRHSSGPAESQKTFNLEH